MESSDSLGSSRNEPIHLALGWAAAPEHQRQRHNGPERRRGFARILEGIQSDAPETSSPGGQLFSRNYSGGAAAKRDHPRSGARYGGLSDSGRAKPAGSRALRSAGFQPALGTGPGVVLNSYVQSQTGPQCLLSRYRKPKTQSSSSTPPLTAIGSELTTTPPTATRNARKAKANRKYSPGLRPVESELLLITHGEPPDRKSDATAAGF